MEEAPERSQTVITGEEMIDLEAYKDMTPEEMAVEIRRTHEGNCCQAVTAALTRDPRLVTAAAGFGGGMGNTQGPCGALVGAVISAGIQTDGQSTTRFSRQIYDKFQQRCGAVICRDLKGIGTGTVLCSCDDCVRNAMQAYQEVFGE